ncbi:MAG: hypothetical protein ACI4PL_03540 [Faecousia sp.]
MHRMKKRALTALFLLGMVLGCHGEYAALFDAETGALFRTLPYRVALFPPADQAALRSGIPAETPQELAGLLEDFFS